MKQRMSFVLCVVSFIGLAITYETVAIVLFDVKVGQYVQDFRNDFLTKLFVVIANIGSIQVYKPLIYILTVYLLIQKRWLAIMFLFINLYGSRYMNFILKGFFERARPDISPLITATGYSFPSGHAMNAVAFIGFIAYLTITENDLKLWQKNVIIIAASILIFSVSLSRIYLGVHYPSDVLAGCAAGGAWLVLCVLFHQYFQQRYEDGKEAVYK